VFLAKLLPVTVYDKLTKSLGMHSQMSDFVGKGDLTQRIPGITK
jgi:hypothetical protein